MSHVSYFRYTFKLTHFFNRYTRSCIFYRSYGTFDYGAAKRPNSSNHQSVCRTASCSCNCYHCHCCCKIGSYPAGGDDLLYVFSLSRSALCAASSRRLVRYCRGLMPMRREDCSCREERLMPRILASRRTETSS